MNSLPRRLLARYYSAIMLLVLIVSGIAFYNSSQKVGGITREDIALAITVIGSVFSFFFVVQKQASEDIQIFKDLFLDFNKRYDELNEKLNYIIEQDPTAPLVESEKDSLNDYFNLCGEEYLYYRQGFILPEVWQAWCNGIYLFMENPRIKPKWTAEEKSASYYGLTMKIVADGAKIEKHRNS